MGLIKAGTLFSHCGLKSVPVDALKQSPIGISSPQDAERSPTVVFVMRSGFLRHTIHPGLSEPSAAASVDSPDSNERIKV